MEVLQIIVSMYMSLSIWIQQRFYFLLLIDESKALCVIFTILVSFSRDNALLFASKAKINVFLNFIFKWSGPMKGTVGQKI